MTGTIVKTEKGGHGFIKPDAEGHADTLVSFSRNALHPAAFMDRGPIAGDAVDYELMFVGVAGRVTLRR